MKTLRVTLNLSGTDSIVLNMNECTNPSKHINTLLKNGIMPSYLVNLLESEEIGTMINTFKKYVKSASKNDRITLFIKPDVLEEIEKHGKKSTVIKRLLFLTLNYSEEELVKLNERISKKSLEINNIADFSFKAPSMEKVRPRELAYLLENSQNGAELRSIFCSLTSVEALARIQSNKSNKANIGKISLSPNSSVRLNDIHYALKNENLCNSISNISGNKKPAIVNYSGSKNESHFNKTFTSMFEKIPCTYTVIETCIGGCGIQPCYYKNYKEYIVSDYDDVVMTMYYCIAFRPFELFETCKKLKENVEVQFVNKLNNNLDDQFYNEVSEFAKKSLNGDNDLNKAALLIFDKACSKQNLYNRSLANYLKAFERHYKNIILLNKQLCNATILNDVQQKQRDLLVLTKYYAKKEDILLLIDPPYYLTDAIYNYDCPSYKYHKMLAELLCKAKCKFCLFLRINASRANKSTNNQALDDALFSFYHNFYYGKGYYVYCDNFHSEEYFINYRNNGTLEVMITNFEYEGAYSLDKVFDLYFSKYVK